MKDESFFIPAISCRIDLRESPGLILFHPKEIWSDVSISYAVE